MSQERAARFAFAALSFSVRAFWLWFLFTRVKKIFFFKH
jgi:hypothetical protein